MANRGLKTLHLRMERHNANAMAVAELLEASPQVDRVHYPGLSSHPHHEVAKKQASGFGGMVTFWIKVWWVCRGRVCVERLNACGPCQGGLSAARCFLESVRVFTLAESLGAVESLAECPAIMTHHSVPPEVR